jgi:hypothetical protein
MGLSENNERALPRRNPEFKQEFAAAVGLKSLRNFGGEYAASTRWRSERDSNERYGQFRDCAAGYPEVARRTASCHPIIFRHLNLQLSGEQSGEQRAGTSSAVAKMLTIAAGTTPTLSPLVGHFRRGGTSLGYWPQD